MYQTKNLYNFTIIICYYHDIYQIINSEFMHKLQPAQFSHEKKTDKQTQRNTDGQIARHNDDQPVLDEELHPLDLVHGVGRVPGHTQIFTCTWIVFNACTIVINFTVFTVWCQHCIGLFVTLYLSAFRFWSCLYAFESYLIIYDYFTSGQPTSLMIQLTEGTEVSDQDGLVMGEGEEGVLAVVVTHPARAHAAERQRVCCKTKY